MLRRWPGGTAASASDNDQASVDRTRNAVGPHHTRGRARNIKPTLSPAPPSSPAAQSSPPHSPQDQRPLFLPDPCAANVFRVQSRPSAPPSVPRTIRSAPYRLTAASIARGPNELHQPPDPASIPRTGFPLAGGPNLGELYHHLLKQAWRDEAICEAVP